MTKGTKRSRLVTGVALALALLVTTAPAASAKKATTRKATTKKATTKKAAKTTKKVTPAATRKPVTTTAPANDGPAKNIVGASLAPGGPIRLGIVGLNANPFSGNTERMYEIALDSLRKQGRIPVHGRDIVPFWRSHDALNPALAVTGPRASCTALAQDDKVFAALVYSGSPECLASDFKIPTIGGNLTDEAMARAFPYAFSLSMSTNDYTANLAPWAESVGILKGRKLGFYHGNAPGRQDQVDRYFEPQLKKLGYSLEEDLSGADEPSDRVAIQRFKSSGVNSIFVTSRWGQLASAGRAQGYKPKFIIGGGEAGSTTGIICDGCPSNASMDRTLFNGSYGMASTRVAENGLAGNPPPHKAGTQCAQNYEKLSGDRVRQDGTFTEQLQWQSVQWSCTQANVLLTALEKAGPNLTQGALINALETATKDLESGFFVNTTYTRTNHFGSQSIRTVQLEEECFCWKVRSPLRGLFVS